MTRYVAFFFTLLALSACAQHFRSYKSMADLTPEQRRDFEKIDAYYFGKAEEQAAFSLNCSKTELTASVVSAKPSGRYLRGSDGWGMDVEQGSMITTIGVQGCGQRASYQVICGPGQRYIAVAETYETPCDVIPSSESGRVVNQNNLEKQRLIDQAASQAAQQQQTK